ncbi:MAG: FKBP-type peptidyl-prolyl cis-trans isomerase [Candidatus Saccharibacteria bacterium]|nr:FKBP-type peptidyl-prolyl cis-trans isomerase [Candidatus Saccharibacteria bacterium]
MAKASQRAAAGLLAAVFFFTSVGATVYVIWQINREEPVATGLEEANTLSSDETIDPNALQGNPLQGFAPRSAAVASLETTDLVVGTGAVATEGSSITAHYTGALVSNGIVFESSLDSGSPFTANLEVPSDANGGQGLISGWVEGLQGMKVGGTRRLVIPYALAYGEAGSPPTIPAKADLVFDIELLDVQ